MIASNNNGVWGCVVGFLGFWSRWFLIVVSFFDHNILFDFSIELSKTKVIIFETKIEHFERSVVFLDSS